MPVAVILVATLMTVLSDTGLRMPVVGVLGKLMWEDMKRYPAEGYIPCVAIRLWGPMAAALMACPDAILQGVKEGGEKPRGARMADKAGWIKKSSGGLLGLWKDRYLLLCQAQLLVYENEVKTHLAVWLGVLGQGAKEWWPGGSHNWP